MHIELTPEQYRLLSENAKTCGLSRREYLVRLLEGTPIRARPSAEVRALRQEIHAIGNNINQIARSVNAGIASPADAEYGLRMMDKVYDLMYLISPD